MPTLFIRWLLVRFGWNVLTMGIALTTLLTLFDALANASAVSAGASAPTVSILFYVLLRLPAICVFILPFAVLIASVQTFAGLAAQSEILALESSGFTLARIVLVLVFGAVSLAALQFCFADRVVTDLTGRLTKWKADGYHGLPKLESSGEAPEWLASADYIVHLTGVSPDGRRLYAPTIIQTNAAGVATHFWDAQVADHDGHKWVFSDVSGRDLDQFSLMNGAKLPLPITTPPQAFSSFAKPVEELRFSQLVTLGWGNIETQIHSSAFYRVWANYRIAQPLSSMVMVLLAAPICLQIQRNGRRVLVSIGVFVLGFLYFIAQSVLLALGESESIPPLAAAWSAFAVFGVAGLAAVALRLK